MMLSDWSLTTGRRILAVVNVQRRLEVVTVVVSVRGQWEKSTEYYLMRNALLIPVVASALRFPVEVIA